jgi:signal recognition particle receptor subunit beta
MARFSAETAGVNARILYWGAPGAGKLTNLRNVAARLRPDHRGEMQSVPTRIDPTVTYTMIPIELGEIGGMRTCIEMVAVPGQPEQAPTRKQLLDEVDGIIFVADSRSERIEENLESLEELRKALADYARPIEEVPLVIQYNKRDLADAFAIDELHRRIALPGATVFEAVASEGTGILQTLSTISKKVIRALREQSLTNQAAPAQAPPPSPAPPPPAQTSPPPSASERMEEAILAEPMHAESADIEADAFAARSLLDRHPLDGIDELAPPAGARIGRDLCIVSVGEASRADERSVRVPLVVGDAEGETSTLVLTVRLDPMLDEDPD